MAKLAAAQEQHLIEFCEEWRQHGLCCDPADFEKGDRIIASFLRKFDTHEPSSFAPGIYKVTTAREYSPGS